MTSQSTLLLAVVALAVVLGAAQLGPAISQRFECAAEHVKDPQHATCQMVKP